MQEMTQETVADIRARDPEMSVHPVASVIKALCDSHEELRRDRDKLRDAIDRVMGLTDTGSQTYRHAAKLYTDGRLPPGQLVSMIRSTLLDYAGCNWPVKHPEPLVSYTRNINQEIVDGCHAAAKWMLDMCWEPEGANPEGTMMRDRLRWQAQCIRLILDEHAVMASELDKIHRKGNP